MRRRHLEDSVLEEHDELRKLFFYFFDIEKKFFDTEDFAEKWADIFVHDFEPKSLANMVYNAAKFTKSRTDKEKTAIADIINGNIESWRSQAQNKIDAFAPQALSNSLWAFATLGIRPEREFMEAWQHSAVLQLEDAPRSFSPQALANSLWAFASLGIHPSPEFLKAWEKNAALQLKENPYGFTPQELSNSVWAMASFGVRPAEEFTEAWQEAFMIQLRAGGALPFNPQDLSSSLWSMATLAVPLRQPFIDLWRDAAGRMIDDFREQDLSASLWACAVVDCLHKRTGLRSVAAACAEKLAADNELTLGKIRQAENACLWFDLPNDFSSASRNDQIMPQEKRKLLDAFASSTAWHLHPTRSVAPLRHKVHSAWTTADSYKTVYLEFDGNRNYLNDISGSDATHGHRLNGKTLFLSALITKFASNAILMRMPLAVVDTIVSMNPGSRKDFLRALKHQAETLPPGRSFSIGIDNHRAPVVEPIPDIAA